MRLGDCRDDLRRVEDLRYLNADDFKGAVEVSPVLHDYLDGRAKLHVHFGVRAGYDCGSPHEFCAWLECRPFRGILPRNRKALGERYVALEEAKETCEYVKRPVLVIVREFRQGKKLIVGGVPSDVSVARLDEGHGILVNSRQATGLVVSEAAECVVNRELNGVRGSLVFQWPARTMSYKLPRNVVKGAPVVVDRIPETSGERRGKIRGRAVHDDAKAEGRSGPSVGEAFVSFWLDTEGWAGVTAEEPARLAPGRGFVEIASRQFRPGTCEGVSHAW